MKRTVLVFLVGPRDAFLVFRAIIPAMQRTRRKGGLDQAAYYDELNIVHRKWETPAYDTSGDLSVALVISRFIFQLVLHSVVSIIPDNYCLLNHAFS